MCILYMLIMLDVKSLVHFFLERLSVADWGDYQCNNAMMIFKEHGAGKTKIDRNVRWVRTEMTAPIQRERLRLSQLESTQSAFGPGLGFDSPLQVGEAIRLEMLKRIETLWEDMRSILQATFHTFSHMFTHFQTMCCTHLYAACIA